MLKDKIENATPTQWVTKGFTDKQVKRIVFFARLKAKVQMLFIRWVYRSITNVWFYFFSLIIGALMGICVMTSLAAYVMYKTNS